MIAPDVQTFTDLYRYRFILSNLVGKELKAQYRDMSLGFVWALLNPLIMVSVLTFVWVVVFKLDLSFATMVVVALIPYNFFDYCLRGCAASIRGNVSLVKRIRFPRQILPISVILTHLTHLAIQSTLIVAALILFPRESPEDTTLTFNLLWLPLILLVHLGLVIGAGLLVAGLNVLYRDVQYIVESSLTVLFWASPIIYTREKLQTGLEKLQADLGWDLSWLYYVYHCNPLAGVLEAYRNVLFYGSSPDLVTFGMATGMTVIVGYVGVRSFWKHERSFADLM